MKFENTAGFAEWLDDNDPLKSYRDQFHIPQFEGRDVAYFCGNSLGLQPKTARKYLEEEMLVWEKMGVEGHFKAENPWFSYHKLCKPMLAGLVGALDHEVVAMNNLTTNIHLLMVSFYRPSGSRFKILMEAGAFPSDQYCVESQARFHGYDPDEAIIELTPKPGEEILRTEDILAAIDKHQNDLALVMLSGVQYYSGQYFDMASITGAARKAGITIGFDLAHAVGNVPLKLHDWGVDFAVWCSYKYLNSGPGGVGGAFVHENHAFKPDLPRFAGWWGHDEEKRFLMQKGFRPEKGVDGWQLSNVTVLSLAVHRASLDIFHAVGMTALRKKSLQLTGYLEWLLLQIAGNAGALRIITPADPEARGCQLSVLVNKDGKSLFERLKAAGVVVDWREPGVIRASPAPLYNTFGDVYRLAQVFADSLYKIS